MARHLLEAGEDVQMLITDKFLQNGEPPRDYPFPSERLKIARLMNRRYELPWPAQQTIDAAVRQSDVLHLMGHLGALAAAATSAARRHAKPWVVCIGGGLPIRGRSLLLKRTFQFAFGERILREAARLIAITPEEKVLLQSYGRVALIPNAIDRSGTSPRSTQTVSPYLLYLGGFHPTKGPDLLVEAFARVANGACKEFRLMMAGAYAELQPAIEELARHRGVHERIDFHHYLDKATMREALAGCAFLVIPSRLDAMTMVVLEAAVAQKPVLLTRGCGFTGVDAVGGGLTVDATVDSLAAGLEEMMKRRVEWPTMGRAMATLLADYSWERVTPLYQKLFHEVVRL